MLGWIACRRLWDNKKGLSKEICSGPMTACRRRPTRMRVPVLGHGAEALQPSAMVSMTYNPLWKCSSLDALNSGHTNPLYEAADDDEDDDTFEEVMPPVDAIVAAVCALITEAFVFSSVFAREDDPLPFDLSIAAECAHLMAVEFSLYDDMLVFDSSIAAER